MGQQQTALGLLGHLKKTSKSEQLINSIDKNINWINSNFKRHQLNSNLYLAIQARAIAARNNLDKTFLPEDKEISHKTRIKFLIFRKARAILTEKPHACLHLVNSILDYFRADLAALLLKGEALAALNKNDKALNIWKDLTRSKDQNIANKASELISQFFSKKALLINAKDSPKQALSFFIEQHLKIGIAPSLNNDIKTIVEKLEQPDTKFPDPDLERHQLQLTFNTHLIESLEARFRERNRLSAASPAQKPGAISKTASKAG